MSYKMFLDEIGKGLPGRNYLFSTGDPFLQSEAIHALRDQVPVEERDFNFQIFDCISAEAPFESVIDVLNTMPFFSGRKIVCVINFQKLLKKDREKLDRYLARPSETSLLALFNAGAVKKDAKTALSGVKTISLDIRESDYPAWLKAKAAHQAVELADDAVEYLIGTIGPDLGLLASEIEKCGLLGKKRVEAADLAEIMEGKRTYGAFDLVNALQRRDAERAFRIYKVLSATEEPFSLLGALNWQYGRTSFEGSDAAAKRRAAEVFRILHEADGGIKSSGSDYPVELLLARLLRLSGQR